MPFQNQPDGLYLVRQKSQAKRVDHYGILDIGNRLGLNEVAPWSQPIVIHQTPPEIQLHWLQDTGSWEILGRVTDEPDAIARINHVRRTPEYDLFGHNCEHFARYVATGKRESTQVQIAVAVAGLVALAFSQ